MALKGKWVDKIDGVDDVMAKDINDIAQSVIVLEDGMGDIDTALDELHAYAQTLAGGETV